MNADRAIRVVALGLPDSGAISVGRSGTTVSVFGHPYLDGKPVGDSLDADELPVDVAVFAKSLDGEFAILIDSAERLIVISDRFVSRPVFYSNHGETFAVSFSYSDMWDWLRASGHLQPNKYAFYELLKFQRLFGDKTLDESSKMLAPASILTLNKDTGDVSLDQYWRPTFEKRSGTTHDVASDLAQAVRDSINLKSSGFENVSLLLSGGMDSRVVLGGFDPGSMPNSITVGANLNNEVMVAQELAGISGSPHYVAERDPSHYADILEMASTAGGSMYSYQHGHFFGLNLPVPTDLLLHGHGFDYMFQGMYLPARRGSFLGRPTRSYKLVEPQDLVGEYFETAKYQIKGVEASALLLEEEYSRANEYSRSSISSVIGDVDGDTVEPYDAWDYLTFGWPGRHYTYLNLLSAESLAQQQTVAWDNTIYHLYHSTPAAIRFGTGLLAETIEMLRPELLKVRNANTNMSPQLSGRALTLAGWRRGLIRRMGIGGGSSRDPSPADRSWPSIGDQLRDLEPLRDRVASLGSSEALESLGLFEMSKISGLVNEFESGSMKPSAGLATLLTIDQFLRRT